MMDDLWLLPAWRAVELLHTGEVTPLELVEACAARIDATDGELNAIPTRCFGRAHDHAQRIMNGTCVVDDEPGVLHGLPIAVKELEDVKGVRTTYGSRIWSDHVPEHSDYMVERLETRGAIVMGKSNVPEFGAGGSSFNEVLGASANPWDLHRTPGGSSGGSAAALAAGQVFLATGSDLGGSLRIPASFCGIVGFRPSPGVVAKGPDPACFADMPVAGPMARNVRDAALMLDAMAGLDERDPLSRAAPSVSYSAQVAQALADEARPECIGYSSDLGFAEVDPEIDEICRTALESLARTGCRITESPLDFSEAPETFHTLRALGFAAGHEEDLHNHRDLLKPEVAWNIRKGLDLSINEVLRAQRLRSALYHRINRFFLSHDLLALPSTVVAALPMHERYLKELNGRQFDNYVDWIMITSAITLTACPAVSIPCGFTKSGLPVGLQLVGPSHSDGRLLGWSGVFERDFGIAECLPIEPRGTRGRYPDPEPEPHGDTGTVSS